MTTLPPALLELIVMPFLVVGNVNVDLSLQIQFCSSVLVQTLARDLKLGTVVRGRYLNFGKTPRMSSPFGEVAL